MPAKQGWFIRLLVRFVLLLLVAAIGGAGYWYVRTARLIGSPPYQAALQYVKESSLLKAKVGAPLGEPSLLANLRNGSSVTDKGERGEAHIQFQLTSPQGPLDVSAQGRKLNNEWSITSLLVQIPGEAERLNLMDEVHLVTAKDTPKFDATKQPAKIDTNINLPDPPEFKLDNLPAVPNK